jgi:hypothetical protein
MRLTNLAETTPADPFGGRFRVELGPLGARVR